MMEDEHEVYGGDIFPEEGDLDGKPINESIKVDGDVVPDDAVSKEELDEMKKRLKEMEEEAAALRDMQAKVEKEMVAGAVQGPAGAEAVALANKEADARSVFVGNVDYSCTPEEVQQHFQSCGTVNRVTILTDKFGQPKGYAYVEFLEEEAVQNAVLLSESELHARQLKVTAKRTNVPGMKAFRGGRDNSVSGTAPGGPICLLMGKHQDTGGQCATGLINRGYHPSRDGLNASSHASSNSSDDDSSDLAGRTTLRSISHPVG